MLLFLLQYRVSLMYKIYHWLIYYQNYCILLLPFEKRLYFHLHKRDMRNKKCSSSSIEFKSQKMQSLYCGGMIMFTH